MRPLGETVNRLLNEPRDSVLRLAPQTMLTESTATGEIGEYCARVRHQLHVAGPSIDLPGTVMLLLASAYRVDQLVLGHAAASLHVQLGRPIFELVLRARFEA